jgi:hypothetical protein
VSGSSLAAKNQRKIREKSEKNQRRMAEEKRRSE